MQVWPALRNLDAITPRTAASRSASSKTMKGALPPNSSERRLSVEAEPCARCLPTGVDPVKESLRTRESFNHGSTPAAGRARDAGATLMTQAGVPALAARNASASADNGVSSAGLAIPVQPAARA